MPGPSSWNLNIKMLPVMWEIIAAKPTITSLTVRFPSTRLPSPVYTVPGLPSLTQLALLNLDPLCYPDSLSHLLCDSHNLQRLRLHWSPRMRRERESSVNLQMYFGKILLTERKLRLRSIAMQNLYTVEHEGNFLGMYDPRTLEAMTSIDSAGGVDDEANMVFVATAPKRLAPMPRLRFLRGNKVSRRHCDALAKMAGLHEYYLITGRVPRDDAGTPSSGSSAIAAGNGSVGSPRRGGPASATSAASPPHSARDADGMSSPFGGPPLPSGWGSVQHTPGSGGQGTPGGHGASGGPSSSAGGSGAADAPIAALGPAYLDAIVGAHGATLQRLLLMPQWRLAARDAALLARGCPQLRQLGCGLAPALGLEALGDALLPGLPHLRALRLLDPTAADEGTGALDVARQLGDEWCVERLGLEAGKAIAARGDTAGRCALRWVGLGDMVFELREPAEQRFAELEGGQRVRLWGAVRRSVKDVAEVEIWKMDRLEI